MNLSRSLFKLILGNRLPRLDGKIIIQGPEKPVTIERDNWGIPYIRSESVTDGWFGLGFCQGQDRSFQLEVAQRVSRGTLSEIIGPLGLPVDRLSRRIGFHRSSVNQMSVLDGPTRSYLKAFTDGVNTGRLEGSSKKAHEFSILRCEPSTFEPQDALGILKLFAFQMGSNWDSELARLRILLNDGRNALEDLDPAYLTVYPDSSTLKPDKDQGNSVLKPLIEDIEAILSVIGQGGGSNNWSLSAKKTATDRPILSNDPHLSPSVPTQWYLASLHTSEWRMIGAAIVGLPGFVAGHNGFAAWGVTAGLADNTDLYIGNPCSNDQNTTNGKIRSFMEHIHIKGGGKTEELVTETNLGPVIGQSLGFPEYSITMNATWLDPVPFDTLVQLPKIRSFQEFKTSWKRWPFSAFNMAYADSNGNIGWQLVGDVPIRTSGKGTLPHPIAENWKDERIPIEELPFRYNPANGIIASANNKPTHNNGYKHHLGHDWVDGYRISRIVESLASRSDWKIQDSMDLQLDKKALPWLEIKEFVIALETNDPEVKLAVQMLSKWDGYLNENSPEASIYEEFLSQLIKSIAMDRAPNSSDWVMGKGFHPLSELTLFAARRVSHTVKCLRERPRHWFASSSWDEQIEKALSNSVKVLKETHGADQSKWGWGYTRKLTIPHFMSAKEPFNRIFNLGPFPWGGDTNTISQAASSPWNPFSKITTIASMRMTIDVGKWDNSRFILPGGQSGNVGSPHYSDMLPLWRSGKGVLIYWDQNKKSRHIRHKLVLSPD